MPANPSRMMVGLGRFELPTNGLGNRCSIHLSYRPVRTYQTQILCRLAIHVYTRWRIPDSFF